MRPDTRGERRFALSLLLPAIALVAIFDYLPMYGLSIAFREFSWRVPFGGPPVGLANIRRLFGDPGFHHALSNTIRYALAGTVGVALTGIAVAVVFHIRSVAGGRPVFSTVVLAPSFVSWVIVSLLLSRLFTVRGWVNALLIRAGVLEQGVAFLTSASLFPVVFVGTSVWKHAGLMAFLSWMLLQQTDPDMRDAAALDGLGPLGTVLRVELASLRPQLVVLTLLIALLLFDSFGEQSLSIASAAIRSHADVVESYAYRIGIQRGRWAVGAAGSLVSALVRLPVVALLVASLVQPHRRRRR